MLPGSAGACTVAARAAAAPPPLMVALTTARTGTGVLDREDGADVVPGAVAVTLMLLLGLPVATIELCFTRAEGVIGGKLLDDAVATGVAAAAAVAEVV